MNVSCSKCATRYTVPDEKVRGRKVRLPCRHCGTAIIIDGRQLGQPGPPSVPRQKAPTSGASPASAPRPKGWSVSIDGTPTSMTVDEIAKGVQSGSITTSTYVWRAGMTEWVMLQSANELSRMLTERGVDLSGGMSEALGDDDDDEATRMVQLDEAVRSVRLGTRPVADRKTPTDAVAPGPALSSAMLDDDEDEATAMFSAAKHGAAPAAALPDALPDDDEDEATAMFSPAKHAAPDLADAVPDDDGEATKMYGPEDHVRVEKTKPGTKGKKKPALPKKPPSRAESAAPALPPQSTSAGNDWEESSVIVEAGAPDENRLSAAAVEGAEERTDRTNAVKKGERTNPTLVTTKKRADIPIGTILLLVALALAAGAAGYLISQRSRPPPGSSTGEAPAFDATRINEPPAPTGAAPLEPEALPEAPEEDDTADEAAEPPAGDPSEPKARATKKSKRAKARQISLAQEAETAPPETAKPGTAVEVPEVQLAEQPEPPKEEEEEDKPPPPLDRAKAEAAVAAAASKAESRCSKPGEPNGSSIVSLSLVPSGNAVGISIRGPLSGTSTGLCILQSFTKINVGPFSGSTTQFSRTVRIR